MPYSFPVVALLTLTLGACGLSPEGDAFRGLVRNKGAIAADAGLENATWYLCNAASVGAIKRKFGQNEEKARTYMELCKDEAQVVGDGGDTD